MPAIAEQLEARHLLVLTVEAVDRFYTPSAGHPSRAHRAPVRPPGPLQRAMTAQPSLAAAVLFTVFREQFAVGEGHYY